MTQFYTYLWLREDRTPYYVGKGTRDRAFVKHWVGKRLKWTPPSKDHIVIYPAESEADALETEIALIWYYGRKDLGLGCLRNFTNGGEGISGFSFSDESKEKIRKSQKARTDLTRFGRFQSQEKRDKIRAARKAMPKVSGCSSRFKNVHKTRFGKYRVVVKTNGKSKHFGTFKTEEEAAIVARGATA
jgi:hypothetical protein